MPEVQIGKYKRPGIFLEEFDNSIIETPIVEGISTLAIGFSKKGPVNTPVVVETLISRTFLVLWIDLWKRRDRSSIERLLNYLRVIQLSV